MRKEEPLSRAWLDEFRPSSPRPQNEGSVQCQSLPTSWRLRSLCWNNVSDRILTRSVAVGEVSARQGEFEEALPAGRGVGVFLVLTASRCADLRELLGASQTSSDLGGLDGSD